MTSTLNSEKSHILGLVVLTKGNESIISLWSKELEYYGDKQTIKIWIRNQLGIEDSVYIEYKEHPFTNDIVPLQEDWNNILKGAKLNVQKNIY